LFSANDASKSVLGGRTLNIPLDPRTVFSRRGRKGRKGKRENGPSGRAYDIPPDPTGRFLGGGRKSPH